MDQVLIPVPGEADTYYLGPIGDSDTSSIISKELPRLPINAPQYNLAGWEDSFHAWPTPIKGWRN